jgi:hypothetical protein
MGRPRATATVPERRSERTRRCVDFTTAFDRQGRTDSHAAELDVFGNEAPRKLRYDIKTSTVIGALRRKLRTILKTLAGIVNDDRRHLFPPVKIDAYRSSRVPGDI